MSHECHSILHFQNVTADDNDEDVMLSDENDTNGNYSNGNGNGNVKDYEDYEDHTTNDTNTDMEKQVNATLLFPTVSFFSIDVCFDLKFSPRESAI
jgi:hypothetical protein